MNKVIEYMHFGLPVVAFDLHETRVSAGSAGIYAKANSEADLAATISALLDSPERMATMAAEGRRRVRDVLAWNHSVAPLLAAYDLAMGQHPSSAVPNRSPAER
jgi:glycosyltransferase involved in cell wall biosynthesis